MSKCVICNFDININFKMSTEPTQSTGDDDDQNPIEVLLNSQNNRVVFKTFCTYFKISSRAWEKLCDNFIFEAASKNSSSNCKKHGKKKKEQDTCESNEDIPVPFCEECLELVKSLSELDKMLQMIQCEVSKMFSSLLTVILTRKNENNNNNNCKVTSDNPHSHTSTPHHDIDEIFGSEIIRLRNCIYEQYTPRLILSDYSKYKSPSHLTTDVKHLTKITNTTNKNEDESDSPLQHKTRKRKRRSIRMRKSTSRFHPQNPVLNNNFNEIVDLEQVQNEPSTTNKTNNNNNDNFTMENLTSPNFMEINDDDYFDEDPLFFNQQEKEEETQQEQDEIQILENNEEKKIKINNTSPVKPLENMEFNPTVVSYCSANNNNNNLNSPLLLTNIKIEAPETMCTAIATTTNATTTLNDCEGPKKSRKAKNEALLKIKHKIEELSTLDVNLNLTKNHNNTCDSPSGPPQILDEIELDSDGEYVNNIDNEDDDNFNGSESSECGSSYDENEEEEDWRALFGHSAAPRKRGRPPGAKNKNKKDKNHEQCENSNLNIQDGQLAAGVKRGKGRPPGAKNKPKNNKNQHENSHVNIYKSQLSGVKKRGQGRPPGAKNKKTIELQRLQQSTEKNPDNNDNNSHDNDKDQNKNKDTIEPSLVFFVKNQRCEKYEKADGTAVYKCCICGFTTTWRISVVSHVDVFHSEKNLQCIYCRGGKYSISTYKYHLKQHHADKKRKDVVIPCGPHLFYYSNHLFEKTESGFKCLHDECHQVFEEIVQETPIPNSTTTLTTISEIDESNINLNPEDSTNEQSSSQNPQDDININNSNQNPVPVPAQIHENENESQPEQKQVQESEKDKEAEEEMKLVKGTESIIQHIKSVHKRKRLSHQSGDSKPRLKSSRIICELCGRSYRTPFFYRHHFNIHHSEERPFVCERCGLSFKTNNRLLRHLETHTSDRMFTCTINGCGKKYTLQRYLNQHVNSDFHMEDKNYTCSICEQQGIVKKFSLRLSLKRHERNHVIERPKNKKCPDCFKGFYTTSEVRQHLIRCPVLLGLQPKPLTEGEETNAIENETGLNNVESHLHANSATTTSTSEINQSPPNLELNVTNYTLTSLD